MFHEDPVHPRLVLVQIVSGGGNGRLCRISEDNGEWDVREVSIRRQEEALLSLRFVSLFFLQNIPISGDGRQWKGSDTSRCTREVTKILN